jgi:hypothetical protein
MSQPEERIDSRRDFFKQLSGKGALRKLGSLVGGSMSLLSELTGEDSPEAAGLALGQNQQLSRLFGLDDNPVRAASEDTATGYGQDGSAPQEGSGLTGDREATEGGSEER